ncbi:LOG family protein [Halomonas koreensis]|uniref:Cytokinin riboside 5'-monophosphate phosphoribohydrolase n=1 Tax=Halomonas koreensis TaxID=245385 RepID=A0ABU1FZV8_9GAMM|nr:TIGR00730 family Rossman fold protein [Halomonas koreensis]MDR5866192.1 TIGR00730 family Rossman fold protein [Halomonas koreensis]
MEDALVELANIQKYERSSAFHVAIFGSARIGKESAYYSKTEELAYSLAASGCQLVSGGGPGIMLAVSEGAVRAEKLSIGLNISLPFEPPDYSLQGESLVFKNFFTRKVAFATYSDAFICMPGGIGTLDEFFEILTLMQTGKMERKPVVLFGKEFWSPLIGWLQDVLNRHQTIAYDDIEQLFLTDDSQEVVMHLMKGITQGG